MTTRGARPVGDEYDYVVVGGGTSGCVVAGRLAERLGPGRVLLVEAGSATDGAACHARVRQLRRFRELLGGPLDWNYKTDSEPGLHDRRITWPRGRGLGGCSAINAGIYLRGHRLDYARWAAQLGGEWSLEQLLPLFKRHERNLRFGEPWHGLHGQLPVGAWPDRNPVGNAFLEAAGQLGWRVDPDWDFNGDQQELVAGFYQHTCDAAGWRSNPATALVAPAADAGILDVATGVYVQQLLWRADRVAGVIGSQPPPGRDSSKFLFTVRASQAVVLSAGTIESPLLLMRSGVGPADLLRAIGVPVVRDLPAVGRNLQDHLVVWVRFAVRQPVIDAAPVPCGGLFLRSSRCPADQAPDLQFQPWSYHRDGAPEFGFGVTLVRPASRGSIEPPPTAEERPRIRAGYLSEPADLEVLAEGVELARQLARTPALAHCLGEELEPLAGKLDHPSLLAAIRQAATTIYHPAGGCSMGTDDLAVTDGQLRVPSIPGLMIADASVMPSIVNANIQACCLMLGERAADLLVSPDEYGPPGTRP